MTEDDMRVMRGMKPLKRLRTTIAVEVLGDADEAELRRDLEAFIRINNSETRGINNSRMLLSMDDSA